MRPPTPSSAAVRVLKTDVELYTYLVRLATSLRSRGAPRPALMLDDARAYAAASSLEFLGESRIALRQLLTQHRELLVDLEQREVEEVVAQIERAVVLRR
jgi:hypothetical protein